MTTAAITKPTRQEVLPPLKPTTMTLETLCKVATSEIDAMSFKELDGFIDLGITCIALNQASIIRARQAMKPALIRIHDMLSNRGTRNDLNDVPVITWKTFCHNKKTLGCRRTLDELIKVAGLENPDKQPKFLVGDKTVLLADGKDHPISYPCEVTHVHEKSNPNDDLKIDVRYKKNDKIVTETVPTTAVEKIQVVKKHLAIGELVILDDIEGGAEYRYDGGKKLTRTDTPSPSQLKQAEKVRREEESKANAKAHKDRIVEAVAAVKDGMAVNDAAKKFKVGRKEASSKLPKVKKAKKAKEAPAPAASPVLDDSIPVVKGLGSAIYRKQGPIDGDKFAVMQAINGGWTSIMIGTDAEVDARLAEIAAKRDSAAA
jgi:hypothetical protein